MYSDSKETDLCVHPSITSENDDEGHENTLQRNCFVIHDNNRGELPLIFQNMNFYTLAVNCEVIKYTKLQCT